MSKFISDEEMAKLEAAQPQSKKFISDDEMVQMEANRPGVGEAIVRGGLQGATLGYSDEITGGIEGVYQYLMNKNPSLKAAYQKARDESRAANAAAQNENPWAYGLSEAGTGMATALIPGLNIAKGVTTAARVGNAIKGGALAASGLSEADLTEGEAGQFAKDVVIGGVAGGVLQGAGEKIIAPALKKAGAGAKNVLDNNSIQKVVGKTLAGVSPEATERYLARSKQVNASDSLEDVAQYFRGGLDSYKNNLAKLDSEAWDVLSSKANIDKDEITAAGEYYIQNVLGGKNSQLTRVAGTGADADKIRAVQKEIEKIKGAFGEKLSEQDLKSTIQSIQKLGFTNSDAAATEALEEFSGVLNGMLKFRNNDYAQKMIPVQEATKTLKSLERQFINRQAQDVDDKFIGVAKRFNNSKTNTEAKNSLRKMDAVTGAGVEDSIKDRLAFEAFEKGDTNGSRKTLGGAIIGGGLGLIGGPMGAISGAVTGAVGGMGADKYAGLAFKKMLNGQMAIEGAFNKIAPSFGKFAQPLSQAAQRGNKALAATHFLLQQNNPEYREMIKNMESEEEE